MEGSNLLTGSASTRAICGESGAVKAEDCANGRLFCMGRTRLHA
jgi:hypothetical protein